MSNFGFVRVAAASPMVKVGDCKYNVEQILASIRKAVDDSVSIVVFPELSITSYTCGDLFNQQLLIDEAEAGLATLCYETKDLPIISIVGFPLRTENKLYNAAAVIASGRIMGVVIKTFLPNYGEFYEKRWFSEARNLKESSVKLCGQSVTVGTNLIFKTPECGFAVELCEDVWTAIPPSSIHALHGAELIFNLSASNELAGKQNYRKSLICQQSARCLAGYIYSSVSSGESTTDVVYGACNLIAENGSLLAEGERYSLESQLIYSDIDIERLRQERIRNKSFSTVEYPMFDDLAYVQISISVKEKIKSSSSLSKSNRDAKEIKGIALSRSVTATPFVPLDKDALNDNCSEVFSIQTIGLAKRMLHTGIKKAVIGVSGGLDSTLALLVLINTFDKLSIPRENIYGITMPGFGTSDRTYNNAISLMQSLGITIKEIPIRDAVVQHFKDIEHDINNHDVTYENSQARERTQILMDYANKVDGLVIGTGDLSELALGWCTYNGDHMSMYAVNASVPKTLVRALVRWVADTIIEGDSKEVLHDIVDTPVSPELLPADTKGEIAQITEEVVGPYILHDFFLYYILRFGFTPAKIYFIAKHAFKGQFADVEILAWMRVCYKRFFTQQFKRSCLPDGPKVGSVSLSPRGDWRMPSDASMSLWMAELEKLESL